MLPEVTPERAPSSASLGVRSAVLKNLTFKRSEADTVHLVLPPSHMSSFLVGEHKKGEMAEECYFLSKVRVLLSWFPFELVFYPTPCVCS